MKPALLLLLVSCAPGGVSPVCDVLDPWTEVTVRGDCWDDDACAVDDPEAWQTACVRELMCAEGDRRVCVHVTDCACLDAFEEACGESAPRPRLCEEGGLDG
jgi:hypothetical protein